MPKEKSLLIIGGGVEALCGVDVAREMGLRVVVLDGNPEAPAKSPADDFILASVYDPEEALTQTLVYTQHHSLHGVIALACDATLTVSRIAGALGLSGPSLETATLATQKHLMKERFQACGVPTPWFAEIHSIEQLREIVESSNTPLVLKPVDSRGARGVVRISEGIDLAWALQYSQSYSTCQKVLLEEWLEGPQVSTESLMWQGRSYLCGAGDRNYSLLPKTFPFVIEDGGESPSQFSPERDTEFNAIMQQAADAIGLRNGTIKGDLVITTQGIKLIEVAVRLSGGYYCTHTIPLVYGTNLLKLAIQVALCDEPDVHSISLHANQYQSNRFLFLEEGVVQAIHHADEVSQYPWVKVLEVYVQKGERISTISDHTKRAGTVLTVGDTRDAAQSRAEQAIQEILVEVTTS